MTKYEKIMTFISLAALCVAAISIGFSCNARTLSQEANNISEEANQLSEKAIALSEQSDLRTRTIEAIDDLQTAIATLRGYEREGATFSNTQREALTLAGQNKREARNLRNSGKYEQSIVAADEGIQFLEWSFPVSQYPEVYYPGAEEGWRKGL